MEKFYPIVYRVESPRKIRMELLSKLITHCLEKYPSDFEEACRRKMGRKLVWLCARACVDLKIREVGGNNHGWFVGMIQAVIGLFKPKGDGQAWCMSAVQTCIAFAEVLANKVSKVPASESCASVRERSKTWNMKKPEASAPGYVWIWIYRETGLGHTGVFDEWVQLMKFANLFEGNTTQGLVDGKIEREGGGYYETVREPNPSGMKLAMVLDPFPEEP